MTTDLVRPGGVYILDSAPSGGWGSSGVDDLPPVKRGDLLGIRVSGYSDPGQNRFKPYRFGASPLNLRPIVRD